MSDVPFQPTDLDAHLVRRLIAAQFPQWADLPISPAEPQGWDNRTFRLGEEVSVRLPSAAGYVPQVAKEHRWLPFLAARLPLPVSVPLGLGQPGEGYPFPWSVYRWLDGDPAGVARPADLTRFARDLARFLAALQDVDAADGPLPGPHSAYRGGPLSTYDAETRRCAAALAGEVDAGAALEVWEAALAASWDGAPTWFHGDVAVNNLLVRDGRLSGVIDFGCAGVGDPACDLVIAWTFFEGDSRLAFRDALPLSPAAWARGRGWAAWKALLVLEQSYRADPANAEEARRVLNEVLADGHARS